MRGGASEMKHEAISSVERCKIIREVKRRGQWEGTRKDHHVRIVWLKTVSGNQIHFSIQLSKYSTMSMRAENVGDAIREINSVIAGSRAHTPEVGRIGK